ncbi:MAG: argininosuccinate lyase [Polyangiaceae bacterium]
MSNLLWDKGGSSVDRDIQDFLAGDDVVLDRQLFVYDIRASQAHVRGLGRISLLTNVEVDALVSKLDALRELFVSGAFVLDERFEDGHSAIESYLTEQLGELGKKVHTGRSRNDQVLVASRLFLLDAVTQLRKLTLDIADACLDRASQDAMTAMPGYTHLQRAMPSSIGMWMGAFAEAFLDNADVARSTHQVLDANPLGTAAGYGVNLALDRDGVTQDLGFSRLMINPMYAQNSRGKLELLVVRAFEQAMLDVRRLAWDLSFYTTSELGFVRLPDKYITGSSLMPNKRNPDVVELLRAAYANVAGAAVELSSLLSLTSGYHRDLQNTKPPTLRVCAHALRALRLVPELVRGMTFDRDRMRAAISPDMFATDRAIELALSGTPFRDAYRQAASEIGELSGAIDASLAGRVSPGAPGNLLLDRLRARLVAAQS